MKNIVRDIYQVLNFSFSSQVALLMLMQLMVGVVLILLTLGVFVKLADKVVDKEVIRLDSIVTQVVYSTRTDELTQVMKDVTFLGGPTFLGVSIIVSIIFLWKSRRKTALVFAFILLTGIVLNLLLKSTFQRPRPVLMPLVEEYSYSFPSGHSMNSFIFFTAVYFYIFRRNKDQATKYILLSVCMAVIFLIGLSRVYLGAHYPSDVIAGYSAGMCWFLLVLLFERSLDFIKDMKRYYSKR